MKILKEEKCGPFTFNPGDTITVKGDIEYHSFWGRCRKIKDHEYIKYEFTEENCPVEIDTVYIVELNNELGLEIGFGGVIGKKK